MGYCRLSGVQLDDPVPGESSTWTRMNGGDGPKRPLTISSRFGGTIRSSSGLRQRWSRRSVWRFSLALRDLYVVQYWIAVLVSISAAFLGGFFIAKVRNRSAEKAYVAEYRRLNKTDQKDGLPGAT